jgi:regulatory protein
MKCERAPSLKARAIRWLAQREHSRSELRDKLLRLLARAATDVDAGLANSPIVSEPEQEVEQLLGWLESRGYLSDQRFIENRTQVRAAKFGNLRIERELCLHGVQIDASAQASLRASELERAREVWRRKFGKAGAALADAAARSKQARFLAGRGFSPQVIRQVLRSTAGDTT